MVTMEKLLVQIFERKKGIIEQVKKRTESYYQHCASKLIIDGITPPPWFWNPTQSLDPKELNKEELISKLLLPHPQPAVQFSTGRFPLYNNPAVTENHREFSDGIFMGNNLEVQGVPMVAAVSVENHSHGALKEHPELDVTSTSPQDETDERILNIYNAPDKSLTGFQRSKSRQKALEQRSSAKAQAKSRLCHENSSDVPPSSVRLSIFASKQNDIGEAPKLSEPYNIRCPSFGDGNMDKVTCKSKEIGINAYTGRTKSRSSLIVPTFANDSSADAEAGSSSSDAVTRKTRSKSICISVLDDEVNEFPRLANPFASSCQGCGDTEIDERGYQSTEKHNNSYTSAHARSGTSGKNQNHASDSSKTKFSSDDPLRMDGTILDAMDKLHVEYVNSSIVANSFSDDPIGSCMARVSMCEDGSGYKEKSTVPSSSRIASNSWSSQQNPLIVAGFALPPHSANGDQQMHAPSISSSRERFNISSEVLGLVKPPAGFVGRMTRSLARLADKDLTEHVNSSNSSTHVATDYKHQNASGVQIVLPWGETHNIINPHRDTEVIVAIDLASRDLVGEQSVNSIPSDTKRRRELECLAARVPSDCFMAVKPKQLDFDDIEEHNLNETSTSSVSRKTVLDGSPENICSLSQHEQAVDKIVSCNNNQSSLEKKSLEKYISSKEKEDMNDSLESDISGQFGIQSKKYRSVTSERPMSKNFENNLGAASQTETLQFLQKADIISSKLVPDIKICQMKLHLNQGHESSLEMQTEDGAYNYEGKDKCASEFCISESQNVRPCYSSNSTNQSSGEQNHCLIEKAGKADSICIVRDEKKQLPQNIQVFSRLDSEFSTKHARNLSCDKEDSDRSPLPQGENCISTRNSVGSSHREDVILSISNASNQVRKHAPTERRFWPAEPGSWPQIKRRKIEDQQTNGFTTSQRFRVQKPYCIYTDPTTCCLKSSGTGDPIFLDAFNIKGSTGMEMPLKEDRNFTEAVKIAPASQNGKGEFHLEEESKLSESSFAINYKQSGASSLSSSTEDDARDTGICPATEMRTMCQGSSYLDVLNPCDEQRSQKLLPQDTNFDLLNSEILAHLEKPLSENKFHHGVDWIPNDKEQAFVDVDQSLPVLEGFVVDAQEDHDEVRIAGDGIDFEKLNLPRATIERASILAQICKSASTDTPLSHISSSFKLQGKDLLHSVPNGLLERLGPLPLSVNVDDQLGFVDSVVNASKMMPYSDCLPYSGARLGWNLGKRHASPVGKLWERLSSRSGDSDNCLSSNPELTCFPIEEDFSISEENKTLENEVNDVQEEIDSSETRHHAQRQPLKDLTNSSLSHSALASAADDMSLSKNIVDVFSAKAGYTRTQNNVKQNSESWFRSNSEAKENQTLSMGVNKIKKAMESFKNSVNKPNLPRRTSLRQEQKLYLKESKRSNIVSNVSSFIPLVQQKQAAAVCTGKRDLRVKALEAAEAAKRLEQKKENERKLRKEALKLERAKMDQENMRQKELEKKKREEEKKAKDADIQAKKRQREEEERKQKEKKRMRMEVRQRQREQEKMCPEKAEKEKQHFRVNGQANSNKESNNQSVRQQNQDNAEGCDVALTEMGTKLEPTALPMDDFQQTTINYEVCSTSYEIGKAKELVNNSSKNDYLYIQKCQEKSYEISPYQFSDDEDEGDDDLPSRKLIPSWASSKSSVALVLPLQREMDPDAIFPQGSFCSMDEVLLPRKLQKKEVAM